MKTKKVILFIVEGITDKTSLGGIIDRLIKSDLVKFYITGGDVTSDKNTDSINAVSKVNELVKRFLLQQLGINKNDLIQIVHLIDTDGAFIGTDQIQQSHVDTLTYSESAIITKDIKRVIERNTRKQQNINRLSLCPSISGIPYSMYYFSCNLEHVLHNEIDLADDLKMEYAEKFSDFYYKNEEAFVEFIRNEEFAVHGEYRETWEFIKLNGNSLKRYSNFQLFFFHRVTSL